MVMLKLEDQPPLIQAIFSGEIDDVRNLLDTKLDVNYQDAEKRSPLHAAAFKGDKELAELLLAQGARVNTKDCKWLTPLHRACGVGSEDTVALLLSHNADTTARDRQWQTPLHIAAANNAVECVSHLLHYVPNVNVTDRSGRTALHHAALNGHNDVVELLISKGCIVNACDKKDCRPIHWAAHLGHVDTMELLMRNGADIHVKDRNQYTPLHVAAASGMLYACRLLLHAGADVDAQNSFGNTPLHIACLNGHLPVCQELAMYNANLEAVNYRGQTPLHIAAASTQGVACLTYLLDQNVNINKQSLDGRTALHMSAIHGRFTRSKTLIDKGAIVDSQDKNGNTALHIAAQYGHDILTTTLLDYGADPNKRGYEGRTPLHSCCLSGFVEVSRKFIQIKVDLNTTDDTGKTAVHCAAYKGSVECLDLLVSQGANFKLQDMYGRTPLHYSATQGHYTCVFTLVGIGAPVNVIDNEGCTPLHLAAAYDLEGRCVEYLLQHKADPKMKDGRGYTPVHYAVNGSNSNSLGHLLEAAGKNYNFQEEGMPLNTPLHLAARRGDIKILISVISYFPDVNIKNDTGCTPLLIAAREGHTHSVQMLLRYGAKVGICEDVHNMSPVHYSAKNGHMHCLALLVDNTEDKNIIDKPDKFNRTALMLAISGSHIKCVLTLLKSEANPNIVDSDRHSSLFRAVVTNQNNVVQYLISNRAYVSEPDINGKTVLHLASACGHFVCLQTIMLFMPVEKAASLDNHDFSALHWGCYHGYYTCVEYLLRKGVFKKIEGNPFSPVHCATFVGSERCLELLYNAFGAEIVKLIDTRKRTPLHIAALHGHTDCARYLLEQGAEIESKDEFGRTALIAASQNGQSQMLELLIAYKANVKSSDNNSNTALHMACLKKHSHTALLLLEYINDVDTINMVNNDKKTPLHLSARNGLVEVTRNLIKKGSSVLAVDSNGLTPALCCAPNPSVAQCLAIILANHPTQFPIVNHSAKAEDQQLFQKLVANLTLPNVTLRTSLIQTDMSLQRDPCELFDAIVQKIKPDYVKKALKPHRKKAHVVYSSPNLHKTHRTKPEIILIEKYGKNDGFDDSFKEVKGLGLHRSFSDIALVPTLADSLDREAAVLRSKMDLRCNRVENLDSVLKPLNRNLKFDDVKLKRQQNLDFRKTEKDFDLILKSEFNKNSRQGGKSNFHFSRSGKVIENDGIENIHLNRETVLKLSSDLDTNFSIKADFNAINIRMAELTEFHDTVQKGVITVANCSIPQKDSTSGKDQPSTSSQSSSSPATPRVINYDDAFKPVTQKIKTAASKVDKPEEEKMRCQGDVALLEENKTEKLCCANSSSSRMRKKLCTCQYVCEKCVLKNTFDEFEVDNVADDLEVKENEENRSTKDADYQLHRVITRKLGINDEEVERDPGNERQLTPAELAAFLRDEPETSSGAYKKQVDGRKISTACSSTSDIWPKVTLDSDRIIMPSDLDQASTTLIKTVESKTSNFSPANSVQLLCDNFDEEKTPSLSNRMSRDSLEDVDRYPDRDTDDVNEDRRFLEVDRRTYIKKSCGSLDSDLIGRTLRSRENADAGVDQKLILDENRKYRSEDQKGMICADVENQKSRKYTSKRCLDNEDKKKCTNQKNLVLRIEDKDQKSYEHCVTNKQVKDQKVDLNNVNRGRSANQKSAVSDSNDGKYGDPRGNICASTNGTDECQNAVLDTGNIRTYTDEEIERFNLRKAEDTSAIENFIPGEYFEKAAANAENEHQGLIFEDVNSNSINNVQEGIKQAVTEPNSLETKSSMSLESSLLAKNKLESTMLSDAESISVLSDDSGIIKYLIMKDDEPSLSESLGTIDTSLNLKNNGDTVGTRSLISKIYNDDSLQLPNFDMISKLNQGATTGKVTQQPINIDGAAIKLSVLTNIESDHLKPSSVMKNTIDTTGLIDVMPLANMKNSADQDNVIQPLKSDNNETNCPPKMKEESTRKTINNDNKGMKKTALQPNQIFKNDTLDKSSVIKKNISSVKKKSLQLDKEMKKIKQPEIPSKLKKDDSISILDNIGRTMESNLEESSSILDRIIKTMERSIEETSAAAIMDSIEGIKQLMMHSNVVLEDVGKTIEDCSCESDAASKASPSPKSPSNPYFEDYRIGFLNPSSMWFDNESSPQTLGIFNDEPSIQDLETSLKKIESVKLNTKNESSNFTLDDETIEASKFNAKTNLGLTSNQSLTLSSTYFNDEGTPSFVHEVLNAQAEDNLSPINLGTISRPLSPTELVYDSTYHRKPADLFKINSSESNDKSTCQISLSGSHNETAYQIRSPSFFNIAATELNDESTIECLETIVSSSDDIKTFRNLGHSETRRTDNLESIIIDNAVVSSSIDPTHVLGRCALDSEYFDQGLEIDKRESLEQIRECFNNPLLKHKSFNETSNVAGSFSAPNEFTVESNIFDGIESEDEVSVSPRCETPEIGDVSVASRRSSKQMSRKSCSKGIKMRMKKNEEVQSSNSHESFLHRNSHYGVYAAHGSDFTREEDAHSQNSSDNEYY